MNRTDFLRRFAAAALASACLSLLISPASASAAPPNSPASAASVPVPPAAAVPAGKTALLIVLPPGTALAAVTSEALGLPKSAVEVHACENAARAAEQILASDNSFILGSLGFYAAHQKTLGLRPLLSLRRKGGQEERYRVLVKKGRFASLADLKGRTLVGTPLHELPAFLNQAVFKGTGLTVSDFRLEPVTRPLRELRKLDSEQRDAVLVDAAQFDSLQTMPLAQSLEVIHVSGPVPSLGLMAKGPRRDLDAKMKEAAQGLCGRQDGSSLCAGFGIEGFGSIDEAAIDAFLRAAGLR